MGMKDLMQYLYALLYYPISVYFLIKNNFWLSCKQLGLWALSGVVLFVSVLLTHDTD